MVLTAAGCVTWGVFLDLSEPSFSFQLEEKAIRISCERVRLGMHFSNSRVTGAG